MNYIIQQLTIKRLAKKTIPTTN